MGCHKLSYHSDYTLKYHIGGIPFGMTMPGRSGNAGDKYTRGFQGQISDDEIAGEGNTLTAEFWEYSTRIGKRWNIDPVVKHHESPYACFANNPIWFIDPNGADSLKILGANNSSMSISYGKGTKTTTYNLSDFGVDLGNQKIDLGEKIPDVIGLDITGILNVGPFTVEGGVNILWHTRGEENCFEPEIYAYNGAGGTASKGILSYDVNASVTASLFWGWAQTKVWDKSTKKLYDTKIVPALDKWVANGFNWTGDFWTSSGSVGQGYQLSFSKFTSLRPGTKLKNNETYWSGYSVGFGLGASAKGGFTKALNFIDVIKGTSLTYTHQYYYLMYGNGRDYGKYGDSLEGWNWYASPKDY